MYQDKWATLTVKSWRKIDGVTIKLAEVNVNLALSINQEKEPIAVQPSGNNVYEIEYEVVVRPASDEDLDMDFADSEVDKIDRRAQSNYVGPYEKVEFGEINSKIK